jgi:hypothetical protein
MKAWRPTACDACPWSVRAEPPRTRVGLYLPAACAVVRAPASSGGVRLPVLAWIAPLLSAILLTVRPASAHNHFELDVALGYRLFGGIDTGDPTPAGRISFDSSPVWGPVFGYRIRRDAFVYLNYTRQETTARFTPAGQALSTESGEIAVDTVQFGGNVERTYGRFVPYLGISIGFAHLGPRNRTARDEWNFTFAFDGGLKFDITPWLHLRALGRLPVTFYGGESSVLCLSGAGCLVKLDGEPSIQLEALGAIGVSFL